MCNPRRISIRTIEHLARQWTAEVVRQARAVGTATGEARVRHAYGESLPEQFRQMFEHRLAREWSPYENGFRMAMQDGAITYFPETGELELSLRIQREFADGATVSDVLQGEVRRDVDIETTGSAYSRKQARRLAHEEGRRQVTAHAEALAAEAEQARREALAQADVSRLDARARALAEQGVRSRIDAAQPGLDAEAARHLEGRRDEYLLAVNRIYAAVLEDVLRMVAERRGAALTQRTDADGVIELSFEVEA
ncbi:MAG: hypothetical protein HOW97_18155 [Catenulispora sp.]|nr:hypothetical protein [Catenulispora sp.]